ncbi:MULTISPECIES: ribosome biogenesis GTPase YlqF [Thiomicrorhabdus]|uniref:Ribosome biogenesis GTPase A n=1 Tax=Thiomicrorhabdus heinhorstiae TaxID=2748010 RepID=A0ABS0BYV8_9GAMM|nr:MULTISPECIES: ribosome biogenesis GTPase YlqF [Thiomicrorhabdus]MBF6058268.1 ribosome biogenesis GTPase YlqF [Thiomicrorhabdus heinhorstiae]
MAIQWYPGHMHKAQKEVREIFNQVDVFIEVLDARIPFSSENPLVAQIRKDKPTIKILNKTDLADPEKTREWQDFLEQQKQVKTLAFNAQQSDKREQVLQLIKKMVPEKADSVKTIYALIIGIPNVGKSTLINAITGRTIAKTGNEPAVTKQQQRIKLEENIILIDTPGMLWPNIENENSGYRLAITGGIKETAFELPDIASYAAEYFLQAYPAAVKERFKLTELPHSDIELLEDIGRQRGCLRGGGMVDLDKVSRLFIMEYRDMKLGAMTLETPEMIEEEWKEVERIRAEKEAKKQAREEAKKERRSRHKKNRR